MIIESFSGRYAFLSNFYPVHHGITLPVYIECTTETDRPVYPTVEHAYQACKAEDPVQRRMIQLCGTPGAAKRLGRVVKMRPEFDHIKDDIMLYLVRAKFEVEPYRGWLQRTENAILIDGNTWGDRYWGTVNGKGLNRLGDILAMVRSEL